MTNQENRIKVKKANKTLFLELRIFDAEQNKKGGHVPRIIAQISKEKSKEIYLKLLETGKKQGYKTSKDSKGIYNLTYTGVNPTNLKSWENFRKFCLNVLETSVRIKSKKSKELKQLDDINLFDKVNSLI